MFPSCVFVRRECAEKAGLERTHLYRKLKQLNIRFSRRTDENPT
jgi:DNA-binding NtrC family response regulator